MNYNLSKDFFCDKCNQKKSTDGALIQRDPRINYNICKECRYVLIDLLNKSEWETLISFLQPERLNPETSNWCEKGIHYRKGTMFDCAHEWECCVCHAIIRRCDSLNSIEI